MTLELEQAPSQYSPEQIDVCLMVVAMYGGRVRTALRELSESYGFKPHEQQVAKWKNELYADRYRELQEEYADAIARRAAARAMELSELAADGVEKFLHKALGAADQIEAETVADIRDLATSARNISQVQANSIEKARLMRDQPTDLHALESLDELVDVLRAAGVVRELPVDADAEEAPLEVEAPADGV